MMCLTFLLCFCAFRIFTRDNLEILIRKQILINSKLSSINQSRNVNYLQASSIATATATVIPTMGLLPAPDNRRRASLQARLQASRGRLLHERCA